jgi:hypothetical protein
MVEGIGVGAGRGRLMDGWLAVAAGWGIQHAEGEEGCSSGVWLEAGRRCSRKGANARLPQLPL